MAEAETTEAEVDDGKIVFDRLPGADDMEQPEGVDLNFGLGEEDNEDETEEVVEETAAETEQEADDDDNEEDEAEIEEEQEEDNSEQAETEEEAVLEETEAEVEEEPEPEAKKKQPMVPKSRLDEVLEKVRQQQKQLDDLKQQQEVVENAPEPYAFDEKELEYQQHVLDGESDKAAALRKEIRNAERAQLEYDMEQKMGQKVVQNQQEMALAQAASEMEKNFPVFDQNSPDFNAEYTQEVVELRDAFIIQGHDAVTALTKATDFVVKDRNLVVNDDATPALAKTQAPKAEKTDDTKKRREVSRKLKAAESQPPDMPGESSASRGEESVNLDNLTEEEFNALPDATLKRLRGDLV